MKDYSLAVRLARLLGEQAEQAVPSDLDLWPEIRDALDRRRARVRSNHWHHATRPSATREPNLSMASAPIDRFRLPETVRKPSLIRQLFAFGSAVTAFVVFAAVLIAVVRPPNGVDRGTGVQSRSVGSIDQSLYVVTSVGVSMIDPDRKRRVFSVDAPFSPDAILSPDGTRLYVAGVGDHGRLAALDAASGTELWRTDVSDRVAYHFGIGPSALAISQDGEHLYVLSARDDPNSTDPTAALYWIRVLDSRTGLIAGESAPVFRSTSEACLPQLQTSSDAATLYLVCQRTAVIRMIDLASLSALDRSITVQGRRIIGSVLSPSGETLYVVSDRSTGLWMSMIDTRSRVIVHEVELSTDTNRGGALALSGDGQRLAIGMTAASSPQAISDIRELRIFEIDSWREIARLAVEPAATGQSLVFGRLEQSLYYASRSLGSAHDSGGNKVSRLDTSTGQTETITVVTGDILHVLAAADD